METETSKEQYIKQLEAELAALRSGQIGNASGTSNMNNEKYMRAKQIEDELNKLTGAPV